ncbi:MAG: hypothetical protein U0Q16_18805 [Bryobacteraceae bacterium]
MGTLRRRSVVTGLAALGASAAYWGWIRGRRSVPPFRGTERRGDDVNPRLRVGGETIGARVALDQSARGIVPEGQGLLLPEVAEGDHLLHVDTPLGPKEVVFRTKKGWAPEVSVPSEKTVVCLVAGSGDEARVWSCRGGVGASADGGATSRHIPVGGLFVSRLGLVSEWTFDFGGHRRRETLVTSGGPWLALFFYSDTPAEEYGSLLIKTNQPGFQLQVDGTDASVEQAGPGIYIASRLKAGRRDVKLLRHGHAVEPAISSVDVRPGSRAETEFVLTRNTGVIKFRRHQEVPFKAAMRQTLGPGHYQGPGTFDDPAELELPLGVYNFTFSAAGYRNAEATVYLRGTQLDVTVDVELKPRAARKK